MTGNSVRRLVRGAIPALTTNPPNLAEIQHLMSLVTPEDLHFDWGLAQRMNVRNNPMSHVSIVDGKDASLGIFIMNRVFTLPLHDHPSMYGFVKVILGKIRVRSYTEIAQDIPAAIQAKGSVVKAVKLMGDTVIDQNGPAAFLTPTERNYHSITSVGGPAAFLDLLFPPYDYATEARVCHYYDEHSPHCGLEQTRIETDSPGHGGGTGDGPSPLENDVTYLVRRRRDDEPDISWSTIPYSGPRLTFQRSSSPPF